MSTHTITLPEEIESQVAEVAKSQGKTADERLEEAVRLQLRESRWQDLLEYGRKKGEESGYTEEDVPEVVRARRRLIANRGK